MDNPNWEDKADELDVMLDDLKAHIDSLKKQSDAVIANLKTQSEAIIASLSAQSSTTVAALASTMKVEAKVFREERKRDFWVKIAWSLMASAVGGFGAGAAIAHFAF